MPREVIKGTMYDLQIGWSENNVQLGVVTSDGKTVIDALGEMTEATGLWATLTPETIDRAISILNRARFKAYPDS